MLPIGGFFHMNHRTINSANGTPTQSRKVRVVEDSSCGSQKRYLKSAILLLRTMGRAMDAEERIQLRFKESTFNFNLIVIQIGTCGRISMDLRVLKRDDATLRLRAESRRCRLG